jgi:drug/metabolite transporter (DMT)-like permease
MHAWRATVGVISLALWFYAIGSGLPLATAMTLNYMSSVWMALFLIGGAVIVGGARIDGRLIATVLAGFAGVALVLRPTIDQAAALAWRGRPGLGHDRRHGLSAGHRARPRGRTRLPDRLLLLGRRRRSSAPRWRCCRAASPGTTARRRAVAAIGLLATAAQLMMTRAYAIGSPLINASLHYTGIGFAFLFGVLWFDEAVSAMALAGIALIVAAGVSATLLRARLAPPLPAAPRDPR